MNFEDDIELIKDILPGTDEPTIRHALEETGDLGSAVDSIIHPHSQSDLKSKRIIVSVNSGCCEDAISGVKDAIASIRSVDLNVSDLSPQGTISVTFHSKPCKPMIYVEPVPLDSQFCQNIEPQSILHTSQFGRIELKVACSLNNLVLLPLTKDDVCSSVRKVLVVNGIIGEGYPIKQKGDVWHEMLCEMPMIRNTYAVAISNVVPSPAAVARGLPDIILSKGGNKIPSRVLSSLSKFFTSNDPNERIETSGVQKRYAVQSREN